MLEDTSLTLQYKSATLNQSTPLKNEKKNNASCSEIPAQAGLLPRTN